MSFVLAQAVALDFAKQFFYIKYYICANEEMSTLASYCREHDAWWKSAQGANGRWSWRHFFRADDSASVRGKRMSALKMAFRRNEQVYSAYDQNGLEFGWYHVS